MKRLIFIGGTMGVGKTTLSHLLRKKLTPSVFLDGDWCWMMEPFTVNDQNKEMVQQNIAFLLRQFLENPGIENVIFCWVMHQQEIIDGLLARLEGLPFQFYSFSLTCSAEGLRRRLERDIASGLRAPGVVERTLPRLPLYQKLNTVLIDADQGVEAELEAVLTHIYQQESENQSALSRKGRPV